MKITDSDIRKIEQLAEAWQVEMPDERFFINLPVKVLESVQVAPRPWWSIAAVPAGAVAAMVVFLGLGSFLTGREIVNNNRLARAAVERSVEDEDWEDIDGLLAEADQASVSGLHRYFKNSSLEKAASALDEYTLAAADDYSLSEE
jgi:hypothetical protein